MTDSERSKGRGGYVISRSVVVGPRVFLEMILSAEPLAAQETRMRPEPGVDSLVSRQLLVSRERFSAALGVALEWSFA